MSTWKKTLMAGAPSEVGYYLLEYKAGEGSTGGMRNIQPSALGAQQTGVTITSGQPGNAYGAAAFISEDGSLRNRTLITNGGSGGVSAGFLNSTTGNTAYFRGGSPEPFFFCDGTTGFPLSSNSKWSAYFGVTQTGQADKVYQMANGDIVWCAAANRKIRSMDLNYTGGNLGWEAGFSTTYDGVWQLIQGNPSALYNDGVEYVSSTQADFANTYKGNAIIKMTSSTSYAAPSTVEFIKILVGQSIGANQQHAVACCDSSSTYVLKTSGGSSSAHNGIFFVKFSNSGGSTQANGAMRFNWANNNEYKVEDGQVCGFDFDGSGNLIGAFHGLKNGSASDSPEGNATYVFSITNSSTPTCNWAYKINFDSTTTPDSRNYIRGSSHMMVDRNGGALYLPLTVQDFSTTIAGAGVADLLFRLPLDGSITAGQYGTSKIQITDETSSFNFDTGDTSGMYDFNSGSVPTMSSGNIGGATAQSSYTAYGYTSYQSDTLTDL